MKYGNCMALFKEILQDHIYIISIHIISIHIMNKQANSLVVLASPNGGIIGICGEKHQHGFPEPQTTRRIST
jgi:hypothetical protein